ncbi:integrin alpha-V-like [Branchiostoma floridae x Branchiostoma belcheri]
MGRLSRLFSGARGSLRPCDVLCLCVLLCLQGVTCFNVDTGDSTSRILTSDTGSLFGFSLDFHTDGGNIWLLSGAPRANTSQPGVVRGGAVLRCEVDPARPDSCTEISFDSTGPQTVDGFQDQKSDQWFGFSVKSASPAKDVVAACAPLYVFYSQNNHTRDPVGNCFLATNGMTTFNNYSPCRALDARALNDRTHHGQCESGFSLDFSKDSEEVLVGAVGDQYWTGTLYTLDLEKTSDPYNNHMYSALPRTNEDDFHLAYSVASGEFTGDGNPDYVVGVPRAGGDPTTENPNFVSGQVRILSKGPGRRLETLTTDPAALESNQFGSNFGYSVIVQDVNNDGLDDIMTGAPMYSSEGFQHVDLGAVYIYLLTQAAQTPTFSAPTVLMGKSAKGRFGTALASLGDINQDGFNDIAVGAPYEGLDAGSNWGVVYIYHGSANGIRAEKPAQVLRASDFSTDLKAFGFSLAGGMDVDGNQYPDMAIGSYLTDRAVVLRSRPIVNMAPNRQVLTVTPELINLESKACSKDGVNVTCFDVLVCFTYDGVNVPDQINVDVEIALDVQQTVKRAVFQSNNMAVERFSGYMVDKGSSCSLIQEKALIQNDIQDKLNPIVVRVKYSLTAPTSAQVGQLTPVLNNNKPSLETQQVSILKDCGPDDKCVPDLKIVSVSAVPDAGVYVGDLDTELVVTAEVENVGEGAYVSTLSLSPPSGVDYIGGDITLATHTGSSNCDLLEVDGSKVVQCPLGNPFQGRATAMLRFSTLSLVGADDSLTFLFYANSTNDEDVATLADNTKELAVPVKVKAAVSLLGASIPEQVVFTKRTDRPNPITKQVDVGPEVTHNYEIRNSGPSDIGSAKLTIMWPSRQKDSDILDNAYILYLLDASVTQGQGRCEVKGSGVNPGGLEAPSTSETTTSASRRRRQAETGEGAEDDGSVTDAEKQTAQATTLDCSNTDCVEIECMIGGLSLGSAVVQIRARLWEKTLLDAGYQETRIETTANLEVVQLLPASLAADSLPSATHKVTTTANPETVSVTSSSIPIWIIAAAAAGGLLLLILIILIMFKCGFFKRKMPTEYQAVKQETAAKRHSKDFEDA